MGPGRNARREDVQEIAIFGAGGHATSVANVALAAGYRITGFIDPAKAGTLLLGYPVMGDLRELPRSGELFAIGIGDNSIRQRILRELEADLSPDRFPALVHPSAVVSAFSVLGEGTVVMPLSVIGPKSRVGRFCILNTRSAIDHDCEMGDFSAMAPAAVTGGHVRIGERAFLGIGAQVRHGVTIGPDTVLGGGSYLDRDLDSQVVAYGSPARVIRHRAPDDPFL